ncbi:MAG: hypothetical protein NTU97_01180 [Candidatus Magasanikbacteria bacterium]|nr:hypothetical protein [Candidatus Magasanikbacteria bacterium]
MSTDVYLIVVVGAFLVFGGVGFLLEKYPPVARVILTLTMSLCLGFFCSEFGIFGDHKWGWSEILTIIWFVMAGVSIALALLASDKAREAAIEESRQKTFYLELRGTYQIQGEYFTLVEHPMLFFYMPTSLSGDEGITVGGHSVVLTVDSDETKSYGSVFDQERFSDGSRPLPVVMFRNLTLFPEPVSKAV